MASRHVHVSSSCGYRSCGQGGKGAVGVGAGDPPPPFYMHMVGASFVRPGSSWWAATCAQQCCAHHGRRQAARLCEAWAVAEIPLNLQPARPVSKFDIKTFDEQLAK
jgi:hypothetical protein